MKRLAPLAAVLFLFVLSACAQDPWKADQIAAEAAAQATRLEAEQQALNAELEREQSVQAHALVMKEEQLKYERSLAVEAEKRAAWQRFYFYTSLMAVACAVFAIFMITRLTVSGFQVAAEGAAKALAQRADLNSRLIYLDARTGLYPLLVEYHGGGRKTITNMNNGEVVYTDQPQPVNPQLATGEIAVKHTYILSKHAKEARRGGDATGVSIIQPPIVGREGINLRDIIDLTARQTEDAMGDD